MSARLLWWNRRWICRSWSWTVADDDLAARVRDYARGPGRAAVAVSSAWLSREFQVDPRTLAAALRPYGVHPSEVERGVRGYLIADLAGLAVDEPGLAPADPFPSGDGVPADYSTAGAPSALDQLSAGAGHDMTGALRAAGLL